MNTIIHITSKSKMKPVDVKSDTYFDFNKESNKEDPKFEADGRVSISKYKNIFAKPYTANWSEEVFVKNTVPVLVILVIMFYKKNLKKTNQTEFRIEKVIKRKGEWKG